MKILKHSFLLLLLSTICSFGFSQSFFNVYQNIGFNSPSSPGCYNTTVTDQDFMWQGANVTVNVTHDFSSTTNVNIVKDMSAKADRVLLFDIYHDDGTNLIFVKTVTSDPKEWVLPSNSSYHLTKEDLGGIPEGHTVVKLRVKYAHPGFSAHVTDLHVNANGNSICNYVDFKQQTVICDFGQIDCFDFFPCGEANITGSASICQGPGGGPAICYSFSANIPNGSGNYTYYWQAFHKGGTKVGNTANFNFFLTTTDHPVVTVTIVDVITGCIYHVSTGGKNATEFEIELENMLQVGPNPASSGAEVTLNFASATKGNVSISLYDLQGREVQRVYEASLEVEGIHYMNFTPNVPAGLYMLSMRNADGITTQRLVIQ